MPEEPHGLGNSDFNAGMKGANYAYPVLELYELVAPERRDEMKGVWGLSAPMGWTYVSWISGRTDGAKKKGRKKD